MDLCENKSFNQRKEIFRDTKILNCWDIENLIYSPNENEIYCLPSVMQDLSLW